MTKDGKSQSKPAAKPGWRIPLDRLDLIGLAGAGALVGGAGWVYPPAALIAAGALALALAVLGARRAEP